MRSLIYPVIVLGLLGQLGCANSHGTTAQETPPMLGAATTPAPAFEQLPGRVPPSLAVDPALNPGMPTEQAAGRVPPGYAAIPVSHDEAVRMMGDIQQSMAMPKIQPGRGIDFDREMQSCVDMLPTNVRTQVEQPK